MDYLTLCQRTAQYSGTIDGTAPTSVTSQVGRLALLVNQVASAWGMVQLEHINDWRWLRAGFTGTLTASSPRYLPASFSLTRHARWIAEFGSLSMYETAIGVSDEGELAFIKYQTWRQTFDRGTQVNARPTQVAISPTEELCFGAVPDTTYTVKGEYMKSKQTLAANSDTPECHSDFHEIIVWKALILLHEFDEAAPNIPVAACVRNYEKLLSELRKKELSTTGLYIAAGPLA